MKCDCHGHSEVDCDPDTGHCRVSRSFENAFDVLCLLDQYSSI